MSVSSTGSSTSSTGTTSSGSTSSSNSSSSSSSSSSSASQITSNVASGIGTGLVSSDNINWSQLVEAAVQQMEEPATSLQSSITANTAKISAYTQMQTNVNALAAAAYALSSPAGLSNQSSDVFAERQATVTSSGTTPTSAVNVTASAGATTGSFTLQVSQLAQNESIASATQSSQTTALGYTGSFSLQEADGTAATINVTSSTTLADLASQINAVSSTTKVQASVVQVSSSAFQLVLSGSNTGQALTITQGSGTNVMQSLGVTDSSGNFTDVLQKQQDAEFTYDGISATRSSNDITDLVSGLNIDLAQTTGSDTLTVNVGNNLTDISSAVQNLVTTYNTYRAFSQAQQTVGSDGTVSSSSVLFGDSSLEDVDSEVYSALTSMVGSNSMALLGLSFDSNNNLKINTSTLANALNNNLSEVQSLFSFNYSSSSPDLAILSHSNNAVGNFTLNVTTDSSGNLTGASVNGNSSYFTVSGATITGAANTPYAGLSFVFTGTSSESINVSTSDGIAEQLYSVTSKYGDATTGILQSEIASLTATNTTNQSRITEIDSEAEVYGQNLTTRYSTYESSIQTATTQVNYLKALLAAASASS